MRTKQLADTAAFDAALIHLSLGPDEQVGTLIVRFHSGVNNLAGTRSMIENG